MQQRNQSNYFALNGQENKLDRMWDRMLQHFHKSTPPAHMHRMLEHRIQHLPLHNTTQLPLNTCISQNTHSHIPKHTYQNRTVHSHNTYQKTYQKHIPGARADNQTNKLIMTFTPPFGHKFDKYTPADGIHNSLPTCREK
ncbi:hypothetical protein QL285_027421 [Trifolium repens]|nr:hypothetical protein QL285_027421 [Trifolium repens]